MKTRIFTGILNNTIRNIITFTALSYFLMFFITLKVSAQVAINEDDALVPNPNTELDIFSTTKGILLPNLSTSQRNSLPSPTEGLIIYNRTVGMFNFYDGTKWCEISRTFLTLSSNPATSGTDVGVGIGIDDPDNSAILHVNANNKGVLIPKLAADPAVGVSTEGMIYYNTTSHRIKFYNGTAWTSLSATQQQSPNVGSGVAAGVLIGTGTVDASAKLEVKTTTGKTMLLPRMTTAQRNMIPSPAEGLLIYNTDNHQLEYFVDSSWYKVN